MAMKFSQRSYYDSKGKKKKKKTLNSSSESIFHFITFIFIDHRAKLTVSLAATFLSPKKTTKQIQHISKL